MTINLKFNFILTMINLEKSNTIIELLILVKFLISTELMYYEFTFLQYS
jgi:hypothetical protein